MLHIVPTPTPHVLDSDILDHAIPQLDDDQVGRDLGGRPKQSHEESLKNATHTQKLALALDRRKRQARAAMATASSPTKRAYLEGMATAFAIARDMAEISAEPTADTVSRTHAGALMYE